MTQPQGALLVGSINFPDAETTFRAAADILGDRLKRIPDGEVGDRFHWIAFQPDVLGRAVGIERVGDAPIFVKNLDVRPVRVAEGVDIASLELPPLGYADSALESWKTFERLRTDGLIPTGTRFQVSFPTPAAVVGAFVVAEQREAFFPVYRAALYAELQRVLDGIPHDSLAIQWDTAVEFIFIEQSGYEERYGGAYAAWFTDVWPFVIGNAVEQAEHVPFDVEVGFHLCYGDAGEKHFTEPKDTANLVKFAQLLVDAAPRPINWIHLPVPIERSDDDYYLPLESLTLPEETELYLGLVHREDGPEGAERRIVTASRHVRSYGVATECGCGRAPEDQMLPLLETHRAVASAW
jgi:hypothetical protein